MANGPVQSIRDFNKLATAPPKTSVAPVANALPEVEVWEHDGWKGWHYRTSLDVSYVGDDMNDEISSIVVYSGTWQFFKDRDFQGPSFTLGPGHYYSADAVGAPHGVPNDTISSFKLIAW